MPPSTPDHQHHVALIYTWTFLWAAAGCGSTALGRFFSTGKQLQQQQQQDKCLVQQQVKHWGHRTTHLSSMHVPQLQQDETLS
jgi:hypothetical protein